MRNKNTREELGIVEIEHKGVTIKTTVGAKAYEDRYGGANNLNFRYTNGNIPIGYEHRPDLIANLFLNSPVSWWIICERNAVFDVFEQLKAGSEIKLPL